MDNILFIDACVRPESRTRELALHLIGRLGGEYTHLRLSELGLGHLTDDMLRKRTAACEAGDFGDPMFDPAKQLAAADTMVIAAPFWDLSFPALLKEYLEAVCVTGITFRYSETGIPIGMCAAKKFYYVTTAGGPIYNDSYCYGYVKDLFTLMFGIPEGCILKAERLDIYGADVDGILQKAREEIDSVIK